MTGNEAFHFIKELTAELVKVMDDSELEYYHKRTHQINALYGLTSLSAGELACDKHAVVVAELRSRGVEHELYDDNLDDSWKAMLLADNVLELIKGRHNPTECMLCHDVPPTVEVIWAEGMARAWFCDPCYAKWKEDELHEVVKERRIDGTADLDWKSENDEQWILVANTSSITIGGDASDSEDEKQPPYKCECIDCGHKMESDKHCMDIVCPKCGGKMRREERPGVGREVLEGGEKPYPNEHACRLKNPADFEPDSFRRTTRKHDGKVYSIIQARLKGQDTMTEQAYRYGVDVWGAGDAKTHCAGHNGTFEPAAKKEEENNV